MLIVDHGELSLPPTDRRHPLVENRGGNQIRAIGVSDHGVHQVTGLEPVASDQRTLPSTSGPW